MNANAPSFARMTKFFPFEYIFWYIIGHYVGLYRVENIPENHLQSMFNVQLISNVTCDIHIPIYRVLFLSMSPVSFLFIHSFIELFLSDKAWIWPDVIPCYGHLLVSKCVRDYNKHENSNITSLWYLALNQFLVIRRTLDTRHR